MRNDILFFILINCAIFAIPSFFSWIVFTVVRTSFSFLSFIELLLERIGKKRTLFHSNILFLFLEKAVLLAYLIPTREIMTILLILMIRSALNILSAEFTRGVDLDDESSWHITVIYFGYISVI